MERIIKDVESLCEQINEDISSNVVCFTGHRSQKLPWGFNEEDIRYKLAKIETSKTLSEEDIDALIDDHFEGAKKVTAEDKEAYRFYLQKLMLW